MISRYQARISGPLMDRIDLNIKVKPVERDLLVSGVKGERSEYIARRVLKAREIQLERFKGEGIFTNAQMDAAQLSKYCSLGEQERAFMGNIMEKLSLSARGYGRILRIARTIADMEGGKRIDISHISEAVQYRFNDFL
jgi:magnesium chelatase family protein